MSTRCCAHCGQPFTRDTPPAEPVLLRESESESQPGHTVSRLRITLLGSLHAACARDLARAKQRARQ